MGSSIQNKEKESDSRKLLTSSSEILDFILKILQVSFICSFSIGFLVIVIFLGREDLLSQTSSFLGSQSVILSIAGAALIVSFVIFTQLMFLPEFVRNSLNRLGILVIESWLLKQVCKKGETFLKILGFTAIKTLFFIFPLLAIFLLITQFNNLIFSQYHLLFIATGAFAIFCAWYCLADAEYRFIPISTLILSSVFIVVVSDMPKNFIRIMGVGQTSITFTIEKKNISMMDNMNFSIYQTSNSEVCLVHKAWLILKVPEKLFLTNNEPNESNTDAHKAYISVPTGSLLNELSNTVDVSKLKKCKLSKEVVSG
jgi:hypothetical protein